MHGLTYRRTNRRLHVRGYKEEGTITTAFDMRVQNEIDRFHLVQDVVDNLDASRQQGRLSQAEDARQADRAQAFHRCAWRGSCRRSAIGNGRRRAEAGAPSPALGEEGLSATRINPNGNMIETDRGLARLSQGPAGDGRKHETIRQSRADGVRFVKLIQDMGIVPGIKVDTGAKDLAGHPGEKVTEGLDGLRERLRDYSEMGARFAKWRAVIASARATEPRLPGANAHALRARPGGWHRADRRVGNHHGGRSFHGDLRRDDRRLCCASPRRKPLAKRASASAACFHRSVPRPQACSPFLTKHMMPPWRRVRSFRVFLIASEAVHSRIRLGTLRGRECRAAVDRRAREGPSEMATHTDPPKAADAKPVAKDDLQKLPMAEVEKRLGSSPDGLTEAEAKKRLAQYGPNEIAEKKTNALLKFLSYFWGPIPWMIEVAVVLSGVVRHWPDFFIILVLLFANAIIGFWEERQAGNAIDALKARLAIKARVKRDGKWVTPPAKELVPGDVIRLRLGDIVPADARLLAGRRNLGRSIRADGRVAADHAKIRRRGVLGFDHTARRDRRAGLRDGAKTYFGKTAELVETAVTVSHFQKAVLKIGDYLIVLAVVMVSVIVGAVDLSRRGGPHHAAIRAGADSRRHSRGDADGVVGDDGGGRAQAREETGDRQQAGRDRGTGGRRRAVRRQDRHVDAEQADARRALLPGRRQARRSHPGRRARLARGERRHHRSGGARRPEGQGRAETLSGHAFHAVRSRAQAHRGDGQRATDGKTFKVTKGAPQVIQGLSANAAAVKDAVDKAVNDFAARGFRALGVARADDDGKWRLLGVLPLFDPPRADAKETIATAAEDGREDQDGDGRRAGDRARDGQDARHGRRTFSTAADSAIPRRRKRLRPPRRSRTPTASRRCFPSTSSTSSTCCKNMITSSA